MSLFAAVAVLLVAICCRPVLSPIRPLNRAVVAHTTTRHADTAGWAQLLDTIATELRTGSTLATAFDAAMVQHPLQGAVLHPGVHLASLGRLDTPLLGAASADERLALGALRAAQRVGGPAGATLDAGAAVLRERIALRAEALVHSAQARASARLLTLLPPAVAVWGAATSSTVRAGLASGPGIVTTLAGLVCNGIGWWWMQHLVHRSVP